jgi:hypothetical protein
MIVASQNGHSITNSMKSPPRDANILQIVPPIVRKFPSFYRIWNFIAAFTKIQVLSYINPVYAVLSYFFKIHFNIGFPFTTIPSKKFLSFRYFKQLLACISLLPHTGHKHSPAQVSWFCRTNNIWKGLQITKLIIMTFPLTLSYFVKCWKR